MSQLSDAINKAVETAMSADGFDATVLAPKVWEDLDEESKKTVGIQELVRRLKAAADSMAKRAVKAMVSAQGELPFNLPGAVSMDLEGRKVKLTRNLSQHEFERAIGIRKKQLADDEAVLKEFEAANRAFRPHWTRNPSWTAGQCLDAIMTGSRKGRAA